MSLEIDHIKRKKIILQKALRLFAEQVYTSVTFQKIAYNLRYSQLETLTFRLIMLGDTDREETSEMLRNILPGLPAREKYETN